MPMISLSYCRVDDQTIDWFVKGLMSYPKCHPIELIDLSYNHISDEACKNLAKLFQANFHIKKLNIGKNVNITKDGLCCITNSIRKNNFVQVIDAQTCNIDLDCMNHAAILERDQIFEDIHENYSLL